MRGKSFIPAALAFGVGVATAQGGVWAGPSGTSGASEHSLWISGVVPDDAELATPGALTRDASDFAAAQVDIPGFDETQSAAGLRGLFGADSTGGSSRGTTARWSRLSTPQGLPVSRDPVERPMFAVAGADADWSAPVGVLFGGDSLRPVSGLARFIPAPGFGGVVIGAGWIAAARRRRG